jgi:lysophospholipase L1-like esterase
MVNANEKILFLFLRILAHALFFCSLILAVKLSFTTMNRTTPKVLVLLLLTALASSVLRGQSPRYDTLRYARAHYQQRVKIFHEEPVRWGRTILLGNSLTEFADWKTWLQDSTVINRGIAGDNTFGILERLDEVISRKPSRLFVEAGINVLSQNIPVEVIAQNLFAIAARVKKQSPVTQVYIYSVLPTNDRVKEEYPDAFNKNHLARALNDLLRSDAGKNSFTFIDLAPLFTDRHGKLREELAEPDGLHLNTDGYQAWVNLLRTSHLLH